MNPLKQGALRHLRFVRARVPARPSSSSPLARSLAGGHVEILGARGVVRVRDREGRTLRDWWRPSPGEIVEVPRGAWVEHAEDWAVDPVAPVPAGDVLGRLRDLEPLDAASEQFGGATVRVALVREGESIHGADVEELTEQELAARVARQEIGRGGRVAQTGASAAALLGGASVIHGGPSFVHADEASGPSELLRLAELGPSPIVDRDPGDEQPESPLAYVARMVDEAKQALRSEEAHASDCATNDEPALPAGACDCLSTVEMADDARRRLDADMGERLRAAQASSAAGALARAVERYLALLDRRGEAPTAGLEVALAAYQHAAKGDGVARG